MYLYMNKKKYMGILRLLRKKAFKLSTLGVSLVGLLVSSGISFAKYIDSNYGGGNAGAAKFGSWHVESNTAPINIPDDATDGWYAFKATFRISFIAGEVSRAYTLKIKNVDANEDANDFDKVKTASHSSFFLSEDTSVYTVAEVNSGESVTPMFIKSDVENFLMDGSNLKFTKNNIYMKCDDSHDGSSSSSSWSESPIDQYYDKEDGSLTLLNDHSLEANKFGVHNYSLIYFVKIEKSKDLNDIKLIYSLDVRQVV